MIEYRGNGDSDSEEDEVDILKAQDEDSEVRLQKCEFVFEKFHNSVVDRLGCDRTYKALKLSGHHWVGMKEELKKYISECTICQKIKWQRPANWEDMVEHHLYSIASLSELSIDTLAPWPEDESGMRYIILIVDNFSKFVGLYPETSTSMLDFVKAFLSWVGIFGVPKTQKSCRVSIHLQYCPRTQGYLKVSAHRRRTLPSSI